MEMSNGEIITSYKQARNKQAQIGVLAELNLCRPQEIVDILAAGGCISGIPTAPPQKSHAVRPRCCLYYMDSGAAAGVIPAAGGGWA